MPLKPPPPPNKTQRQPSQQKRHHGSIPALWYGTNGCMVLVSYQHDTVQPPQKGPAWYGTLVHIEP